MGLIVLVIIHMYTTLIVMLGLPVAEISNTNWWDQQARYPIKPQIANDSHRQL